MPNGTKLFKPEVLKLISIRTIPAARRLWVRSRRKDDTRRRHGLLPFRNFDINMPILYGENMKTFTRLREELVEASNDPLKFAFLYSRTKNNTHPSPKVLQTPCDLFATSPRVFITCRLLVHAKTMIQWNDSFASTKRGLYFPSC